MTYLIIQDDPAATLSIVRRPPTIDLIRSELRNTSWCHVRLPAGTGVMTWMSDVGNVNEKFHRNLVASCLTMALGANPTVVGGPLLLSGYDYALTGEDAGLPLPLLPASVPTLIGLYVTILDALDMTVPANAVPHRSEYVITPQWQDAVRRSAKMFREAAQPRMTLGHVSLPADPKAAAAAVLERLDEFERTDGPAVDLIVKTRNPELLETTLKQLARCELVHGSLDGETCRIRVYEKAGFVKFALKNQGYGQLVREEPVPDGAP